ncbi:MAG: DUF58 domain-containing protein [Bacteroidota bacterium]|nr:DUF58 domain-containing protein [Bacteroidota bacterium]
MSGTRSLDLSRVQFSGSLEFLARQVVEGFITGLHKSPFHGFSVEFAEHRQYNTGESVRNIDWKLYGRTERLYVKRFEEETNLRCQILIDNSSSMQYPVIPDPGPDKLNKITFSIYAAASLIYLFHKQRDASGISIFSDRIELHTETRSNAVHQKYLFGELERLLASPPDGSRKTTSAAEALHLLAERIHKRSLVIIFSDMMESSGNTEELFSALQHLRHNKHEVVLFHVTDKKRESDFNFDNRPYRFIDLETGEDLKVFPSRVKEQYTEAIRKYNNELKIKCGQYMIDFVEADINEGFEHILLPYLVKREKLF